MSDIKLKKQISELRSSLFEKQSDNKNTKPTPANINSNIKNKSSGIFNDVRSMDSRLERLEDTFYNYAYDSTKILTSFHRNTKILEQLINEISKKNESSSKIINKIDRQLPHTCPLVPKEGSTVIKKGRSIFRTAIFYFGILITITLAVFISNLVYEVIYLKLNS